MEQLRLEKEKEEKEQDGALWMAQNLKEKLLRLGREKALIISMKRKITTRWRKMN